MPLFSGGPPNSSSMQNRVHCGVNSVPPEKMPVMPVSREAAAAFFQRQAQRLDQLRRAEHALHVVPGAEDRDRLIDAVLLVRFEVLHPALLDELDDPPRIEIDAEANAAAMLGQVLDRQPQPPRAGRAEHQPVRAQRKILLRQRVAEQRVVDAKVFDRDAALRDAGRAARFEHVDRLVGQAPSAPTAAPARRGAIRPRTAETSCRSSKDWTSRSGSNFSFRLKSSQNGQPVDS